MPVGSWSGKARTTWPTAMLPMTRAPTAKRTSTRCAGIEIRIVSCPEGAERFALSEGFSPVDPRSLVHPREYQGYKAWVRAGRPDARMFFDEEGGAGDETGGRAEHGKRGTVGVVIGVRGAAEGSFALFAGASTGGTRGLGGGIMAIDPQGRTGASFTTPDMAYAGPSCRQLVV